MEFLAIKNIEILEKSIKVEDIWIGNCCLDKKRFINQIKRDLKPYLEKLEKVNEG